VALSTGQHLAARLHEASVQIDSAQEPSDALGVAAPVAPVDATTALVGPLVSPALAPSVGLTAGPSGPSWPKLVAAGDYARVMREAESEGMGHALAARPLPDLRALGDAARYVGSSGAAKRAYSAIRARFASSGEARTAAFLLGRVAEEQDHAVAEALRWYDVYLAEAPGGAFAGDALGRKMVLLSKSQGRDAARPLAERYLQRFPAGPYAAAARDLAP
jgi:hypothetical protein